jgi:hypothetical protein
MMKSHGSFAQPPASVSRISSRSVLGSASRDTSSCGQATPPLE